MKKSPSFKKFVSLSLLVHVLVLGGLLLFGDLEALKPKPTQSVSIDLLTPEDLAKMAAAEKLQEKTQVATVPANQVVEQNENSVNEKEPVNSRFLSAKNQVVTKQTIAANRGQFQNLKKAAPAKSGPKGNDHEKSAVKEEVKANEEKVAKDLFKSFDPNEAMERQRKKDLAQKAEKTGEGLGHGDGSDVAREGADASRTDDYIKDVDTGLETMLNTREFKYYSYYNRIRRQLAQHWEGKVREKLSKMFKEGRSPASSGQDRVTKLMIILNDKGTLVRVLVLGDSGVRDLDDAAVEAFRAAAPFPNPPKGIIEGDGTVKIRWDFVLES